MLICICSSLLPTFVCLQEAGASFQGQAVYGIQTLSVGAHRLQSIVADCAAAGKSSDARDKYFESYVGEYAPCSSKALRSELPALEAGADQQEDALQCFLCLSGTGRASIVSICRVCLSRGAAENEIMPRRGSSGSLLEKRSWCACRVGWCGHLLCALCCQALRLCWPMVLEVLITTCAPPAQGSRWQKMWIGRTV